MMHSLMCVSPLLHVSRMNSLMLSSYSLRATDLTRYARRYYAHILCTSAIHSPQLAVLTRYQGPLACIACVPSATRMADAPLRLQTDAVTEHSAGTLPPPGLEVLLLQSTALAPLGALRENALPHHGEQQTPQLLIMCCVGRSAVSLLR